MAAMNHFAMTAIVALFFARAAAGAKVGAAAGIVYGPI
jgi:hypothetical protein